MPTHGLLRVAAASPELRVADPAFNADRSAELLLAAADRGVDLIVFPECGLTAYTCGDLFHHKRLLDAAEEALAKLLAVPFPGVAVVGLPVLLDGMVFNAAAVIHDGKLLGVIPKTHLPNYKEFYDARYFAPAANAVSPSIRLAGHSAPFGTDIVFECTSPGYAGFVLGVEICEDLWMPIAPSSRQAVGGATVLANLSASNEVIGKATYRKQLVAGQSGRCIAGYIYAACGVGESSTDLVFGGHCLIAENGSLIAESPRFRRGNQLLVADLDLDRLARDRATGSSFNDARRGTPAFRRVPFQLDEQKRTPVLERFVDPHPFVPSDPLTRDERCEEIFATQVAALGKRLGHIGSPPVAIGVSGGLDSTLALLVVCKTFDSLGVSREKIKALTMPGFGTTTGTKGNAHTLMKALGVGVKEIDIRELCLAEMRALGHSPFGLPLDGHSIHTLTDAVSQLPADKRSDLTFENVQARVRTNLLMNTAFVIGTGDVSELALGWCTYNADHMSMYNPNVSIPKTLVRFLVRWAADHEFDGEVRKTLHAIADTPISPELLPTAADGSIAQATESTVGPYELVDFFLYHFLRWGCEPAKILFLASQTKFDTAYTADEVRRWLRVFLTRFFANQFKRSCLPDGPKVGSVSVSPRGDWRMPSDAAAKAWLESGPLAPRAD
jgi:NAD+ synthase (glutamine-hydrolysing)